MSEATTNAPDQATGQELDAPNNVSQTEHQEPPKSGADVARQRLMNDSDFWGKMFSSKEKPGDEAGKPADGAEAKEADKPEDKPADKPEKVEKPKAKKKVAEKEQPKEAPQIDSSQIIDMATTAAVAAARSAAEVNTQRREEKKVEEKSPIDILGADSKDDLDELGEMERLFPDKYRGITNKFVEFKKAEKDYIQKWKKENPGEKFDRDDEVHDSFYEVTEPEWSESDRRKAQRSIIIREAEEAAAKKVAPIEEQIKMERAQARVAPEVERTTQNSFAHILVSLNPEFEQHLSAEDGLQKIEAADPVAIDSAKEAFLEARGACVEAVKLWNGASKLDAGGNPDHARVAEAFAGIERDVAALPRNQQFDNNGRLFATHKEYASLPEAERARRWTIGLNEVVYRISQDAAAKAAKIHKERTAIFDSYIKRMGLQKNQAVTASQKPVKEEAAKPSPPAAQRHPLFAPPSAPRGAADSSASKQPSGGAGTFEENFGLFK